MMRILLLALIFTLLICCRKDQLADRSLMIEYDTLLSQGYIRIEEVDVEILQKRNDGVVTQFFFDDRSDYARNVTWILPLASREKNHIERILRKYSCFVVNADESSRIGSINCLFENDTYRYSVDSINTDSFNLSIQYEFQKLRNFNSAQSLFFRKDKDTR